MVACNMGMMIRMLKPKGRNALSMCTYNPTNKCDNSYGI